MCAFVTCQNHVLNTIYFAQSSLGHHFNFEIVFLHFDPSSTILCNLVKLRPVQSLIFYCPIFLIIVSSSHLFYCFFFFYLSLVCQRMVRCDRSILSICSFCFFHNGEIVMRADGGLECRHTFQLVMRSEMFSSLWWHSISNASVLFSCSGVRLQISQPIT